MEKELEMLMNGLTPSEADKFADSFDAFGEDDISAVEQERILSSVMRKAGKDMKETITVNKTKKRGKRFAGFMIAAAVLTTGAIGAGAYAAYSSGFFNGVKAFYPDATKEDNDNIAMITEDGDASILENTFDGLDFTVDGVLNDGILNYVMLTVSRTDGTPFTLDEGENFYFKYSGGAVPEDYDYIFYNFKDGKPYLNADGTLSVLVKHTWIPEAGTYKAQLVGLYKSAMSESYYMDEFREVALGATNSSVKSESGEPSPEYDEAYQSAIDAVATEKYEGRLLFTYTISDEINYVHILPEENEFGYELLISNMRIVGYSDEQDFAKSHDISVYDNYVTIYMEDGTSFDMEGGEGWSELTTIDEDSGLEYFEYGGSQFRCDYPRPIDCTKVTAVEINGNRIDIK